jgi:hypothetical protein
MMCSFVSVCVQFSLHVMMFLCCNLKFVLSLVMCVLVLNSVCFSLVFVIDTLGVTLGPNSPVSQACPNMTVVPALGSCCLYYTVLVAQTVTHS